MKVRRYTLGPKSPAIHAVVGLHTLCGLSLAFAADPREVTGEITCQSCTTSDTALRKDVAA